MLAAGKIFENLPIFIGFGALFHQSGNPPAPPDPPPKKLIGFLLLTKMIFLDNFFGPGSVDPKNP